MLPVLALAMPVDVCSGCLPGPRGGIEGQQEGRLPGAGLKAADLSVLGPVGYS